MIDNTILESLIKLSEDMSRQGIVVNGGIKFHRDQTESGFYKSDELKRLVKDHNGNEIKYIYMLFFIPRENKTYYLPITYFSGDSSKFKKRFVKMNQRPERIYLDQNKIEISTGARKLLKDYYTNLRNTTTLDRWL